MVDNNLKEQLQTAEFRREIKDRSDRLMNYFLVSYFVLGLVLAGFYETWWIAIGIGLLNLAAYYSVKILLPDSNLYQYVLSVVLGIFMAQYIYQMHGMFEMHFSAFIGSAILITYQNWKLQVPMLIVVGVHHAVFGYLQNIGYTNIYFTQLNSLELQTIIIHMVLAGIIFFICGLWSYQLKKYNELHIIQALKVSKLQKEAMLTIQRKQNEEVLRISNNELRKSNQELDKFVYSVSHDLRAPLTSLLGLIEISEEDLQDPFMAKNLGLMKNSIHKLDGFINDILVYSRNARLGLSLDEINLEELVEETISHVKYMNRDKQPIDININVPFGTTLVSDKHRVKIILNNLVSNAIRYYNPAAVHSFININVTENNGISIAIEDNGVGIKKELQSKIFNMFYRVSQNSQGSGLGLYIVKQTLEKLGGTIEVDSEINKGSIFTVHLPHIKGTVIKKDRRAKEYV